MKYSEYLGRRENTFIKSFEHIKKHINGKKYI